MTVAVLDIETQNWDRFVVGCLRLPSGEHRVHWDADDMFSEVMAYEGEIWTWNGGRYDLVWLASVAARKRVTLRARMAGGRIVRAEIGKATLCDGFALWPEPLRAAAEITGGLEKGDFDYERIGEGMSQAERRALAEYLTRDCDVTAGIIRGLRDFAATLGIELALTVGGTAWKAASTLYGLPSADWRFAGDYTFARSGYYGGRTEVFRARAPLVHRYDINSAYPAALASCAVPTGAYKRLTGRDAQAAYSAGRPGIYEARVIVPRTHIPPLPLRGNDRLLWVHGRIQGTWTREELQHGESEGVSIEGVTQAITWEREEKILAPFMERFWNARSTYGKKSAQGRWLKWLVNSLTGKLAMRPEGERVVVAPDPDRVRGCPANYPCFGVACGRGGACCKHRCSGECGRWNALDPNFIVWSAPEWRLPECGHVQWAAVLTAATRRTLHKMLMSAGEGAAYADTDSCYRVTPTTRDVGNALGQWNYEGVGLDWYARGPKAYRYAEAETGEYKVKAKGVTGLNAIEFDRWSQGESVLSDRGVWGIKGGARRGSIFERRVLSRAAKSSNRIAGSRVVAAGGDTRSLSLDEWLRLQKEMKHGEAESDDRV